MVAGWVTQPGCHRLQADYLISCEATQGRCRSKSTWLPPGKGRDLVGVEMASGEGCSRTEEKAKARLLAWRPGGWRDTKEMESGTVFRLLVVVEEGLAAPKPASHPAVSAITDLNLSQEEAR